VTRGEIWTQNMLETPRAVPSATRSVLAVDGTLDGEPWRAIAVVSDTEGAFPRARSGEAGLEEGLALAATVRDAPRGTAILAIVDVPGQAFGRREEAAGLHLMLGAAVEAYAMRRQSGEQVFALVVGHAISGAFLAHGMQAGWIGALRDAEIEIHVMSAASVARVTRATPQEVARMATIVPATARDVETFERFGAIDRLFAVRDARTPTPDELALVRETLVGARAAHDGVRPPRSRLERGGAHETRAAALAVRAAMRRAWDA